VWVATGSAQCRAQAASDMLRSLPSALATVSDCQAEDHSACTSVARGKSGKLGRQDDTPDLEGEAGVWSRWPAVERRRMKAAMESLFDACAWQSLRAFKHQLPDAEWQALRDVFWAVRDEVHRSSSSIQKDAALCDSLSARLHALRLHQGCTTLPGRCGIVESRDCGTDHTAEQAVVTVFSEVRDPVDLGSLRRQLRGLQWRLERKYVRKALLGLLAVLDYAWGDSGLLDEVTRMAKSGN
jgi:hypothetical protein